MYRLEVLAAFPSRMEVLGGNGSNYEARPARRKASLVGMSACSCVAM